MQKLAIACCIHDDRYYLAESIDAFQGADSLTMLQGTSLTTYSYDSTGNLTVENVGGSRTSYAYDDENA